MPAGFEYHLDYRIIDAAAWDQVTLAEFDAYLLQAARLSSDLRGAVEYLDLSEAFSLQINGVGALQLAMNYERLADRGIRGSIIYAPREETYAFAGLIIDTCSIVSGLPDGYRRTRTPVRLRDVHDFLDAHSDAAHASAMVA